MADTQEAVRKHVLQEAVDEFLRREGIRLQAVAIAAIPICVIARMTLRCVEVRQ